MSSLLVVSTLIVLSSSLVVRTNSFVGTSLVSSHVRPFLFQGYHNNGCRRAGAVYPVSESNREDEHDDTSESDVRKIFSKGPTEGKSSDSLTEEFSSLTTKGKLGINFGSVLAPLTEREAAELKAAAAEAINEAVAAGIDEIEEMRVKMKEELELQRLEMQRESEYNMEKASQALLQKIDAMTQSFLTETALSRTSTKLAAMADQSMEGRGVDMGTWGTLGGATVVTGIVGQEASLASGKGATSSSSKQSGGTGKPQTNRLLIVANTKDDTYAKLIVEPLSKQLEQVLPKGALEIETIRTTDTWPLGGNGAVAVLLFLTSLNDASTVRNGLERLLRQTITSGGQLAQTPTQIVAVSTVGTARTNQMPYSMQNMWSGRQLEKRKQMEEAVQNFVEQKFKQKEPFLDYTICKLGDITKGTGSSKEPFALAPGDVLDGALDVDSAVIVLKQAIALQQAARNTTFCCVGGSVEQLTQAEWDDLFLQLDGPELWRTTVAEGTYDQLVEYLKEWSTLPATSKGLTTPVRIESAPVAQLPFGIRKQDAIRLLFLPTATGTRYTSRDEEKEQERDRSMPGSSNVATTSSSPKKSRTPAKEGGLEILVEVTEAPNVGVRVRVRRCNYAPGVVIKELTEETLLSRIKKALDVWNKDLAR